jgi:putative spermidine/putrescine transport system substrate-binding protein
MTRRQLLGGGLAAASGIGLGSIVAGCGSADREGTPAAAESPQGAGAATSTSEPFTGTLRVLGYSINLIEPIRQAAEKDLGFSIFFDLAPDEDSVRERVATQPTSFDILSEHHSHLDWLWPSGNLQPVEISRIPRWNEITPLYKLGKIEPGDPSCTYGERDAPYRNVYVDPDRSGRWTTPPSTLPELDGVLVEWLDETSEQGRGDEPAFSSMVPGVLGADSFGYNGDVLRQEPEEISWAELLNPSWRGRVGLVNLPSQAFHEIGMAARALGLMEFASLGDPTREEIVGVLAIILDLQDNGHIRAFWSEFTESVELMASGDVVIESMYQPAVALLQAQRFPVRYALPPEGSRGFSGGFAISASITDPSTLQASYDFINWWYSGFPAAVMMRQSFYYAVQETSRGFVEPGEYAYWIEGAPADRDYPGPFGDVSIHKGQVRDGGPFEQRVCRIAVWNSVFEQIPYLNERWGELVSA